MYRVLFFARAQKIYGKFMEKNIQVPILILHLLQLSAGLDEKHELAGSQRFDSADGGQLKQICVL